MDDRLHEILHRRFGTVRAGFELVGIEDVAIPMSILTLDVVVQLRKRIPVIEEFVLRCADIGVTRMGDVSSLLGLEMPEVVNAAVAQMQVDTLEVRAGPEKPADGNEEDHRAQPSGDAVLTLTEQGLVTAKKLMLIQPERREVSIAFDRLLWKPSQARGLLRGKDVKALGLKRIPAHTSRRPTSSDLTLQDVEPIIRSWLRGDAGQADLLAIRSLTRVEERFLPAQLLVYRARQSDDVEVSLAIDERVDPEHDRAIENIGGATRLGVVVDREALEPDEVPSDLRTLSVSIDEVAEIRSRIREAEHTLEHLAAAEAVDLEDDRAGAVDDESRAAQDLLNARSDLAAMPVRGVETYEHAELLKRSVHTAAVRLLIISPWITGAVVNRSFLAALEGRCSAGVRVHIGYGISAPEDDERNDNRAVPKLEALAARFDNFTLTRLGDTHAKVLIWDGESVTTSFNWLSFRGERGRTFRQEEGILVADVRLVDDQYARMLARFGNLPEEAALLAGAQGSASQVPELMRAGESRLVEFKSSARWSLEKKAKDPAIEFAIVKTVAAFMNTEGGSLLIGVRDDGVPVGLENDYKLIKGSSQDQFENWLTTHLEQHIGRPAIAHLTVQFETIEGHDVCCVGVRASPSPVFVRTKTEDGIFFMRANNSSRPLSARDAVLYCKEHWDS